MHHATSRARDGDVLCEGRDWFLVVSFHGHTLAVPMIGQHDPLRCGDVRLNDEDVPGMTLRKAMLVRTRDVRPVPTGAMALWRATEPLMRRVRVGLEREIALERNRVLPQASRDHTEKCVKF